MIASRNGLLLLCLIAGFACACPARSHSGGETKPTATMKRGVVSIATTGRHLRLQVEVAQDPEQRARGLMFRKALADSAGMLFIFDTAEVQSFWMKNTYIPLDMIFIDDRKRVVGIVHQAEPLTLDARTVEKKARYVLEINGGLAKKNGIEAGAQVHFEGIAE